MKYKFLIFLILFPIFLIGCSNNKEKTNSINSQKNKQTITLEEIIDIEEKSTINKENININSTSINIEETTSNLEVESIIEKDINQNINIMKNIELEKVNKFIEPKEYILNNLQESKNFKDFQEYISDGLEKNCGIYIKDNYISYNGTTNGPSIEMYINEDYYAIFLYCILNENINDKDNTIINKNNEVLKSLLNTFTPDSNLLYEKIYEDYEINSNISEENYINIGNSQIKSEILQKCVIYYIKNN